MFDEIRAEEAPGRAAGASLRRTVLLLAWPEVVQNFMRTLMLLVDTFMIGRVGRDALAAMGIAGQVSHTMIADWLARTAILYAVYRRGRWKAIKL